jgi:hypothetical protein
MEAPAIKAATVEEEAEIEGIIHLEEENVVPQCVRVARKQGDEWVFYEKDNSDRAVHKLHQTVDDLMGQIKVRALEPRPCPSSFCSEIAIINTSLCCRALKKHRSTKNGASTQSSRQWKKIRP